MAAPTTTSFNRYLRGPYDSASYPAASGIQINVGDLVYLRSGDVAPISQYPCLSGSEVQTWSGLRSQFLGVSQGQHNSTITQSGSHQIPVSLDGIYSYPCPVATSGTVYQPGLFVNSTQGAHSGYYGAQELMQCSGQATGIGKVVEVVASQASGVANLVVYLQSTVAKGVIAGV